MRIALLTTGLLAGLVVLLSAFVLDEGEVVTLTTASPSGVRYETSLWVVEDAGSLWLRSGLPDAHWLERLRLQPEITVARHGKPVAYQAVPVDDAAVRARVNEAMAVKYGAAAHFVAQLVALERSVPIRLDPSSAAPATAAPSAHP